MPITRLAGTSAGVPVVRRYFANGRYGLKGDFGWCHHAQDRALQQRLQEWETSSLRYEALEDHLIRMLCDPRPLLGRTHGPAEQGAAEHIAGDPGGGGGQVVDLEGDEMRLGLEAVAQVQHAVALLPG